MEPFPPPVESPQFKDALLGPQVQINELPASSRILNGLNTSLRRANTVAQGGNIKRNLELKAARDRTETGIYAKNSHEPLRQSDLQRSQTHRGPLEARPPGRKAGHFTVRSVGQNGKIFLRPIANPPQKGPQPAYYSPAETAKPNFLRPQQHANVRVDSSRWSSSQLSELRPREQPEDPEPVSPNSPHDLSSQHRARPISFSTISEQQSTAGAGKRGELRIVIDRPEDRPKSAHDSSTPALEVPIPRYRLGSPLFSADGSVMMQSSIYTQSSMLDQFRNSTLLGNRADPLQSLHSPYPRDSLSRNRPSFAISMFSGPAAGIDMSRASLAPRNSMVHELKEPVEPSIYETLVYDMDDGSVVRYVPGTKDVSAATPARIVAQISSESFMDYELVSDFFLTFRSYLSTSHLLALLLARLKWAINRLQDDGRIIRIRTFAALRHWILNYFLDDFVTNYELRTNFCDTINELYAEVRSRNHGGTSDRKILIDLKRCWNGKCSMYWSSPELSCAYNDPENPILPGDAQIELPRAENLHQITPPSATTPHADTTFRESNPLSTQHDRSDSAATEQSIPFSTKSEQSLMALSCSLPPKSPKRFSMSASKGKAPRPVVLGHAKSKSPSRTQEPPTSPVSSKARHPYGHSHKRSGSFSDSVRDDRVPMFTTETNMGTAPQEILDPISLIRGEMYPPAESYMTMMAPESPPLPPPSKNAGPDRRSTPDAPKSTPNSGMRTIIGSIKRALHTRNGGQSVSARIANAHEAVSLPSRGKVSAMPTGMAFGSELYRERKMAAAPKHPARIDVLCDEVLRQYRQAMIKEEMKDHEQPPVSSDVQQMSTQDIPPETNGILLPIQSPNSDHKSRSEIATPGESIIIVDDAGFEMASIAGAATGSIPNTGDITHSKSVYDVSDDASTQSIPEEGERLRPVCYNAYEPEAVVQPDLSHPPGPFIPKRSSSIERGSTPTNRKRVSLSLRLRKYASFQSGIARQRYSMSSEATQSTAGSNATQDQNDNRPGPILRRRRGGNLRQMQTGDEPDALAGRHSFASWDDSVMDSMATSDGSGSRPPSALIPPNPRYSLIQPPASPHLRRSFESVLAKFAELPDDDDGGIESTLLKLEGKWDGPASGNRASAPAQAGTSHYNREQPLMAHGLETVRPAWDIISRRRQTDKSSYSTVGGRLAPPRPYSDSVAESEESYNSIPLLERGLTDDSMKWQATSDPIHYEPHGVPLTLESSQDTFEIVSSHPSIQIVHETDSMRRIPRGATNPPSLHYDPDQMTPRRFSALSSEMSVDMIDRHEALGARRSTDTRSLNSSTVEIPPHPLAQPPSPPMTIQHPGSFTSYPSPLDNTVLYQAKPLTPDTSPRHKTVGNIASRPMNIQQISNDVLHTSENSHPGQNASINPTPDHVPFILSCESQVLAQQLTIVEMAALSEIDWRDLVEMKWSSACPLVTNWVQFLAYEERKGIDLVVGRFNLMVKWILSEIVLTSDINERARTIIKYIHTAAHARRICNYATMLQIAIALSSSDCSRLQSTWQLISADDKRLFKDMECLIQPVRNFNDLRVEMETANLQEGCIPFIGLYVHDLTYNAQKPAQVNNSTGGLLVNFERYRTAARIVKSLLRLIDASTKYRFEPVPGIIERCLWIACLPDDEIQARSKALE